MATRKCLECRNNAHSSLRVNHGVRQYDEPLQSLVEMDNVDLYLVGTMGSISQELRPYARRIFELDKEPLARALQLQGNIVPPAA